MELLRQSGGEDTRCIRIEAHIKDSKKLSDESRGYFRHDADHTGYTLADTASLNPSSKGSSLSFDVASGHMRQSGHANAKGPVLSLMTESCMVCDGDV